MDPNPLSWAQMAAGSQPAIPSRRHTEVLLDKVPEAHDLETLRTKLNTKFDTSKIIGIRRLPSKNVILSSVDKSTADSVSLSATTLSQVIGGTVEVRPPMYRVLVHGIPINAFDLRTPEGRAQGCNRFQDHNQHIPGMANVAWFNPRHTTGQTEASMVVVFHTPHQADDAIRHGLEGKVPELRGASPSVVQQLLGKEQIHSQGQGGQAHQSPLLWRGVLRSGRAGRVHAPPDRATKMVSRP